MAQRIDEFIDIQALQAEKQVFLSMFEELKKAYDDVNRKQITLKGASNAKEFTNSIRENSEATKAAAKAQEDFTKAVIAQERVQQIKLKTDQEVIKTIQAEEKAEQERIKSTNIRGKASATIAEAEARNTAANEKAKRELLKTDQELAKTQTAKERANAAFLKSQQEQLKVDTDDIKVTREKIKAEIEEERLAQQQLRTASLRVAESNKALKLEEKEAKVINDLSNDYKQLSLAYSEAALKAKNLALQQGSGSKAAKEALTNANALGNKLKEVDALTGSFQRNVGNYPKFEAAANSISNLLTAAAAGVGIASISDFFSSSIDEANQAEQATTRFRNALANIAREDVFERLSAKADDFVNTFRYLDNDDVTEVFQQLITYGKLTEKQITDLTPVIINFAAKSGLSLNDAASTIIKALEGNARALKDYGINIKEGTTVTERLNVVMTDLKSKVDGAADAFGKTFAGQAATAKQEIANFKEEIGNELTPVLGKFYQSVYFAIQGIKSIAGTVKEAFTNAFGALALGAGVLKDIATFDFSNIGKRINKHKEEITTVQENIRVQKELGEIRKIADQVAADAADKPLKAQQQILAANIALRDASKKAYDDLIAQGKQLTEAGKAAARQYSIDAHVVMALQEGIKATQDKTVLGTGNPDASKTRTKTAKDVKTITDAVVELRKELEKIQKNVDIEQVTVSDADVQRVKAYQETFNKIFERGGKADAPIVRTLLVEMAPISQRILEGQIKELVDKLQKSTKGVDLLPPPNPAKAIEIGQSYREGEIAMTEEMLQRELVLQQTALLREQSLLEEKYAAGKITRENYERELLDIQIKYSRKAVEEQIKSVQAEITNMDAGTVARENAEKRLAELQLNYNKIVADDRKKKNQEIVEDLEKLQATVNQLTALGSDIVNIGVVKQKNELQKLEDTRQQNYQQEIERINNSTLSEEEKANRLKLLEAKRQAQKEEYDRKNRQIQQRQAEYEKKVAIMNIILNTAVAVAKVLGNPFAVAFALAMGAAQLAVAIATPIPKYKHGKFTDYQGIAEVGDGGNKEVILREDGNVEITPDKPTYTWLGRKDLVYPDVKTFTNTITTKQTDKIISNPSFRKDNNKELITAYRQSATRLENAIKKIPQPKINFYNNGEFNEWVRINVRGRR